MALKNLPKNKGCKLNLTKPDPNPIWHFCFYLSLVYLYWYLNCIELLNCLCNTDIKVNVACGTLVSRTLKSRGDLWNSSGGTWSCLCQVETWWSWLFIGVNMVLLMPFMPLHLHIREFHYFISGVAYKKVMYVGPGDTQDESIIVTCYMGHLKGNSTSCCVCGTIIQCVFTPFLCTTACLISCLTRITQ